MPTRMRRILPRKRLGPGPGLVERSFGDDSGMWASIGGPSGQASGHATSVSARNAQTIAAIKQAVEVYINAIAPLDLYIAERHANGGYSQAREHPNYDLVHSRPNRITTSYQFRATILGHALTRGNGYAEIERDVEARPRWLHLMDPRNVRPKVDGDGSLYYCQLDGGDDLPARDVIHIKTPGFNGIEGYSPVALAADVGSLMKARDVYERGLMENNGNPGGHIETPGNFANEVAKQQFLSSWEKRHKGPSNAGKTALLTGGTKWVSESFSPVDSDLILSRAFSIAEIARFWNLPPSKLGLMEKASYASLEEQNIDFYQQSVYPWLVNIEQELDLKLFSAFERKTYCVKHNVDSLLRSNTQAQTERDKSMFAVGAWSINEIRLAHGQTPLDEPRADMHWLPVNNVQAIEDMDAVPPETPAQIDPDDASDEPTEADPKEDEGSESDG